MFEFKIECLIIKFNVFNFIIECLLLTLIGSWKKTYVNGKGGGKNDPKTKIAVTFFLLKIYWWNFQGW